MREFIAVMFVGVELCAQYRSIHKYYQFQPYIYADTILRMDIIWGRILFMLGMSFTPPARWERHVKTLNIVYNANPY